MGLALTPALTPQVVSAAVSGQITSSRLYTQMAPLPGDALMASTTAEQPYASTYTVPANSLVVGQAIHIRGAGVYTTSALTPPTQRARLRANGVTLIDSGPVGVLVSLTAARYMYDLQFIVRSVGVTGTVEAFGRLEFATSLTGVQTVLAGPSGAVGDAGNPVTVDTTQPLQLVLSCQFGAALAGNSNAMRQIAIHTLRPVS